MLSKVNTQKKGKGSAHCAKKEKHGNVVDNEALHTSDVENKSGWIVASGATQHMTFERDHLTDFVEFKKPWEVNLGDNRTILAYGKGNYDIIADLDGCIQNISLKEVLYLPDLGKNLLPVRAMVKLGPLVTFEGDICKATRNSKLLGIGETCGKLYMLKVIPSNEEVNVAKEDPNLHLWYRRFGHLGVDNLTKLINENMVDGMNTTGQSGDNSTCESCMMGKQHQTAYPKEIPYRATQPFEIVHSDVCGPMHVNSHGNSKYFVTFVDDYSRYIHVYFIKSKDEVLQKFKEFAKYAANTTGKKVKVLRSDNGGEYCLKAFKAYLKESGITMVEYTKPQFRTTRQKMG